MNLNVCNFSLDRDGVLRVKIQDEVETVKAKGVKAIRALRHVDSLDLVGIKFVNGNVYLYERDSRIVIENYNEMLNSGMLDQCPRTKRIIIEHYRQYKATNPSRAPKKKKKRKLKPGVKKVLITSTMILVLLGVGRGLITTADNNYPNDINLNPQVYEQVVENDNNYYLDDVTIENNDVEEHTTGSIEEKDDVVIFERAADNSSSQKAVQAREWYNVVEKYANQYGISPNLPMAVLTQESGGDNSFRDGLMQIQFWSWEDMPVRAYNFETGKTDTIVLTNTPNKYKNSGYTVYTREDLRNPEINIKCGIIFLRYSILNLDGNIAYGTYAYNMGVTNIINLIERYIAQNPELTFDEVIEDTTHINNLVDLAKQTIDVGDWNYPNNVVQYAEGEEFSIKLIQDDGSIEVNSFEFEHGNGLGH